MRHWVLLRTIINSSTHVPAYCAQNLEYLENQARKREIAGIIGRAIWAVHFTSAMANSVLLRDWHPPSTLLKHYWKNYRFSLLKKMFFRPLHIFGHMGQTINDRVRCLKIWMKNSSSLLLKISISLFFLNCIELVCKLTQ